MKSDTSIILNYNNLSLSKEIEVDISNQTKSNLLFSVKLNNIDIPIVNLITSFAIINIFNIVFYFKNRIKSSKVNDGINDKSPDFTMPELRLSFFKDFNNTVLTVDGLIITIVGGFLSIDNPKNLLIFQGFVILVMSIIYSFLAHSYLASGIVKKYNEEILINSDSFIAYSSNANYAFWYFIMGLSLIIGGIVLHA